MKNTISSERTLLGMSQDQLAEKLGKSRGTIVRWENNPLIITGTNLVELSNVFGCSIDYLLGRTEERLLKQVS